MRAPHKLKSAVSGCIRECAEAQSKDFGLIATEKGWNLYVCGNGGAKPRHADLLAADLDEDDADPATSTASSCTTSRPPTGSTRTARWLENLDGGIDYLRAVVVDDALGIGAQLEQDMARLVASYACEWAAVVRDPERRRQFRLLADGRRQDDGFVRERGQKRPRQWPDETPLAPRPSAEVPGGGWVLVARAADVPRDGGITITHGSHRVAVFHFATQGGWWATQATCPHRKDDVLGRGLLGTEGATPKVACPLHKKTFSLLTGEGLADPRYCIRTYPVEIRDGAVWVKLPPVQPAAETPAAPPEARACERA